jgi:hypothetical protein
MIKVKANSLKSLGARLLLEILSKFVMMSQFQPILFSFRAVNQKELFLLKLKI